MCQRVSTADTHFFLLKGGTVAGGTALPPWQVHFARHFLLKYLTSAWESAEANYSLMPGTFL